MEPNLNKAVYVGIFFTGALIIVMFLSLQVGNTTFFEDNYRVVGNFEKIQGIDPGAKVTIRGKPVGSVANMDWDSERLTIRVTMLIEGEYRIPVESSAKVTMGSLLGGNYINIEVPRDATKDYLQEGDEIQTEETRTLADVMETVTEISAQAEKLVASFEESQGGLLGKIEAVIEENRDNLRKTTEAFANAGPKLEQLSDDLTEITSAIKSGEGTIGRLYKDESLYEDFRSLQGDLDEVITNAREIGDQIKSGEGTLGQLIYRDDLTTDARNVMEDLQAAANEVQTAIGENRQGIQDAIEAFKNAGPEIEKAVNDLRTIANKINEGEGTLGRLVNDEALYEDTRKAVNQVGESFENAEEAGVFQSFLGVVFGALI